MKKTSRRTRQTNGTDSSTSSLSQSPAVDDKERYEKRVYELEQENDALKRTVEQMRCKEASASPDPDVGAKKLKEAHLEKMNALEGQVLELKRKLELQFQRSTQKPKGDVESKRFHDEIQKLRVQKVQLQCKLKLEAAQFRLCKASLQKKIFQLKKENRRNEYELHLLSALNQRQKLVSQRKTEEAFMATKRLKELLESRKARGTAGSKVHSISQSQSIEHELEVTVQVQKVCSEYERELEEMAGIVHKLKIEAQVLKEENSRCLLEDLEADTGLKDSELCDLKEDVATLSSLISQMVLPKAEVISQKSQVKVIRAHYSASVGSSSSITQTDTSESDFSAGGVAAMEKPATGVCCSCSKKSLCKTSKCECRVSGGCCGTSCGCAVAKCTNRESGTIETDKTSSSSTSKEMLPQNPLLEKHPEMKDDWRTKKQPLREIGNKLMKTISLKPGHRKRGQKTVSEHEPADELVPITIGNH